MTDEQLQQCLDFWRENLGLRDWRISAKLVDSEDAESAGQCCVHHDDKLALIRIQQPEAHDKTDGWYKAFPDHYDPEKMVIHELIHIHFDGLMEDDADDHQYIDQEQAINALTNALYELSR
jgi:hypothetical protein